MKKSGLSPARAAERSIQKKYVKTIWNPFVGAVKRYRLLAPGDRIAVCISGGKDSFLTAKLLQMLQRHSEQPFELIFLCMDPGYSPQNREAILQNAARLELPVSFFETNIFAVADKADRSPCYLCARMRRGHLYKEAQRRGCNKIALGHHFSDVVETTLMSMLYGAQIQTMPPKLRSRNFEGMELIRPLYCVHEDDILAWQRYNGLEFLRCACRVAEKNAVSDDGSKRQEMKLLLREMKKTHPTVEKCVFQSMHNVRLDTVISYTRKGAEYSFLDDY
ncbi:MAG: tRNA 2-thiocytidine biosynthesis protein TtcA [Oscillospiraceae bacterium]|nr:tRNA 2-thiocytidine biosynthesis protein TtcA [Oscillospiraceae bacterium]